jgi:hypothetical protein
LILFGGAMTRSKKALRNIRRLADFIDRDAFKSINDHGYATFDLGVINGEQNTLKINTMTESYQLVTYIESNLGSYGCRSYDLCPERTPELLLSLEKRMLNVAKEKALDDIKKKKALEEERLAENTVRQIPGLEF